MLKAGNENGKYHFEFRIKGLSWLDLHLDYQKSNGSPHKGLMENFLMAENDSVHIKLVPRESPIQNALGQYDNGDPIIPDTWIVTASGKGSDKYNAKQFLDSFVDTTIAVYKRGDKSDLANLGKLSFSEITKQLNAMSLGDSAFCSEQASGVLVANALGKIKMRMAKDLRNGNFTDIPEYLEIVEFSEKDYTSTDLLKFAKSPIFQQYLEAYFLMKLQFQQQSKDLAAGYFLIKENIKYPELREKVITNFLMHRFHFDPSAKILEDARYWMNDTLCVPVIIRLGNTIKGENIEFSLPDLAGKMHYRKDYQGKIVLIDFWFMSCAPCKAFMKNYLRPLAEHFKDDERFQIITISIDDRHIFEKSVRLVDFLPVPGLHLYTNGLRTKHPLIKSLEIHSYPRPFLLDKEGRIVATKNDFKELGSIIKLVDQYLK
ncbi:TlpA family protein disulfide reductase [Sphingobacterium faecale]|uniref:TlpA family protein disulfide reductase n=1 Tax=Sphingobacterium faecale TaxID=2803775 RepID=A0ABS1R6S3_9SPHI|nr:TlpA disulfide reductase family protein [Sphingobacterium faecale]MBL1410406.1 TlpA family protein disulfide reductase [Sphingobacterium faecale]